MHDQFSSEGFKMREQSGPLRVTNVVSFTNVSHTGGAVSRA